MQYYVMSVDPADGREIYGPYPTEDAALEALGEIEQRDNDPHFDYDILMPTWQRYRMSD